MGTISFRSPCEFWGLNSLLTGPHFEGFVITVFLLLCRCDIDYPSLYLCVYFCQGVRVMSSIGLICS